MRVRYGNGAAECVGSCVKNTALNSFVLKCCGYKFAGSNVKNRAFNLFAKKVLRVQVSKSEHLIHL